MVPELGSDSPQISILRVDPKTNATQLLIRTPTKMHVPMHWHSANETHTMIQGTAVFEHEGKREQLGPGGFNSSRPRCSTRHGLQRGRLSLSRSMAPGT
jgi:quercetin dioxygenase-like cupin family protein